MGRLLCRRLTSAGHERILHVAPAISGHNIVPRSTLAGYCDAADEAGLAPDPELVVDSNYLGKALPSLVKGRRFSAVYSDTDSVPAIMASLHAAGLSVPEDISYMTYKKCAPCFFGGLTSDSIAFPELDHETAFGDWFHLRLLDKINGGVFQRTIAAELTPGETIKTQASRRQTA